MATNKFRAFVEGIMTTTGTKLPTEKDYMDAVRNDQMARMVSVGGGARSEERRVGKEC